MIPYKEIVSQLKDPELVQNEKDLLLDLEKLTDQEITSQFPKNRIVDIDMDLVEKILTPLNAWRKDVVTFAWIEKVKEAGWDINHDYQNSCYSLVGK
jgi:hypothetical protein